MSLLTFGKKDKIEQAVNLTAEAAKRCLNMPEFKEYRDRFEAMERKINDEMLSDAANFLTQNESLEKFGTKCLVKLTRIRDLRAFSTQVTNDARKQ